MYPFPYNWEPEELTAQTRLKPWISDNNIQIQKQNKQVDNCKLQPLEKLRIAAKLEGLNKRVQ